MAAYHIEKIILSPAEAVRISRHMSMSTGFKLIPAYFRAVAEAIPYEPVMGSEAVREAEILMSFWTAGRIQGIREERQRRRAKKHQAQQKALNAVELWEMDNETIDGLFNGLLPSEQRRVLIVGLMSVLRSRGCIDENAAA